jgi:hypothetical protein
MQILQLYMTFCCITLLMIVALLAIDDRMNNI